MQKDKRNCSQRQHLRHFIQFQYLYFNLLSLLFLCFFCRSDLPYFSSSVLSWYFPPLSPSPPPSLPTNLRFLFSPLACLSFLPLLLSNLLSKYENCQFFVPIHLLHSLPAPLRPFPEYSVSRDR